MFALLYVHFNNKPFQQQAKCDMLIWHARVTLLVVEHGVLAFASVFCFMTNVALTHSP